MNYEELNDKEIRRKVSNYCNWLQQVEYVRSELRHSENEVSKLTRRLDRLLKYTEEERLEFDFSKESVDEKW